MKSRRRISPCVWAVSAAALLLAGICYADEEETRIEVDAYGTTKIYHEDGGVEYIYPEHDEKLSAAEIGLTRVGGSYGDLLVYCGTDSVQMLVEVTSEEAERFVYNCETDMGTSGGYGKFLLEDGAGIYVIQNIRNAGRTSTIDARIENMKDAHMDQGKQLESFHICIEAGQD